MINGEEIVTTVDHPFYVKNQGFIKAGELIVGDELLDVNGNVLLVENFDGMKLFLIGGMEDLNFNYCYKITYESGETYDRRRNELSVEISKEDYKKIITGVLQERSIDQIE